MHYEFYRTLSNRRRVEEGEREGERERENERGEGKEEGKEDIDETKEMKSERYRKIKKG